MSLDTRMAFERQQPPLDLRAFLDPLKPGSYFDCGEARLAGIDDALEAEAVRRGRSVGDDEFQLVATDGGLIFCRASISFAIAARWKDLTIGRPVGTDNGGTVLLPVVWPTHGNLEFTVSRRLGSNVFRRWLQIQAQATRRSQVEQDGSPERQRRAMEAGDLGLTRPIPAGTIPAPSRCGVNGTLDLRFEDPAIDLGEAVGAGADAVVAAAANGAADAERDADTDSAGAGTTDADTDFVDSADADTDFADTADGGAIGGWNRTGSSTVGSHQLDPEDVTDDESAAEPPVDIPVEPDGPPPLNRPTATTAESAEPSGGDWSALDEALLDSWVDDRAPDPVAVRAEPLLGSEFGDDDPTSDPFEPRDRPRSFGDEASWGDSQSDQRSVGELLDDLVEDVVERPPEAAATPRREEPPAGGWQPVVAEKTEKTATPEIARDLADDPSATQFMPRTMDGTEVFPGGGAVADFGDDVSGVAPTRYDGVGRRPSRPEARLSRPASEWGDVPIPEIQGARLQKPPRSAGDVGPGPMDIRSTVLAGGQESPLVLLLRERRLPILAAVSIFAIVLLVIIGLIAGGPDAERTTASGAGAADSGATPTSQVTAATTLTTTTSTVETTVVEQSALRVTTSSIQICHSNYGGCVPVAADVDCEGDGDGPAFQADPVAVFGDDVYDLDTDDDRQACEPDQPPASASGG